MALHAIGEVLCQPPGAGNEHEPRIVATPSDRLERVPEEHASRQRDGRLGDEQEDEEETADILLLEDEQRRQRYGQDQEGRPRDVTGFGPQAPSDAQPIHAHQPQRGDPGDREQQRGQANVEAGLAP